MPESARPAAAASAPPPPSGRRALWGDRSVRTKILSIAALSTAFAVGGGVIGILGLASEADLAHGLYTANVHGVASAAEMKTDFLTMRLDARAAPLELTADKVQQDFARLATDYAAFQKAAAGYAATQDDDPQAKAMVTAVQDTAAQYMQLQTTVLQPLAAARDTVGWQTANSGQVTPLGMKVEAGIDALVTRESGQAAAADTQATGQYHSGRTTSVIALVVGVLATIVLGLVVARGIVRSTRRVQGMAEALATGDLTLSTGLTTRDELGRMGRSLDTAVVELRGVMATVVSSADAVAASSEELSASSAQISASAEETSAQSGVVAGAADEVSRNVQTVAAGAEQMGASIREIASNAAQASEVAARAVTAVETTSATVTKLGDSSAEIGNVVKVITSIAEQTNLLALNATIEAARAGEAGKGFAVVANEVKELAQETAKATEDIARRVQAIQGDTTAAVAAIEEISAIVAQISDRQTTIASAVEEQTATTQEMSRSVAEAADGTGQIASNISGVSGAAEATTQALGQTRTAVDELSRMAADLRTTVSRFTY